MQWMRATSIAMALIISAILHSSSAALADVTLAVQLRGTGAPLESLDELPQIGGVQVQGTLGENLFCYQMNLIDIENYWVVGQGIDCLSDIVADAATGSIELIDTAFFIFASGETIVSRDMVRVEPILNPSTGVTHLTGSIPALDTRNRLVQLGVSNISVKPAAVDAHKSI